MCIRDSLYALPFKLPLSHSIPSSCVWHYTAPRNCVHCAVTTMTTTDCRWESWRNRCPTLMTDILTYWWTETQCTVWTTKKSSQTNRVVDRDTLSHAEDRKRAEMTDKLNDWQRDTHCYMQTTKDGYENLKKWLTSWLAETHHTYTWEDVQNWLTQWLSGWLTQITYIRAYIREKMSRNN